MVLDDGVDAVRACGVLLVHRDDEAAQFKQERERGNSRRQVVVVYCGLRPLLRGALVLVATVTMAKMGKATTAAATREVVLPRRGNAMAICAKQGCMRPKTLAQAQCRTVHPYVGCAVGAKESVGLAGPIKMSGGTGVWPSVATHLCLLYLLTLLGLVARL